MKAKRRYRLQSIGRLDDAIGKLKIERKALMDKNLSHKQHKFDSLRPAALFTDHFPSKSQSSFWKKTTIKIKVCIWM